MVYKKISFVLFERTPYHDILLDNLNKNNMVNLKIYYLRQKSEKRPWDFSKTGPKSYHCHTYRKYFKNFIGNLAKDKPDLVITAGYAHLKLILTYLFMKMLRIRFAMWGDVDRVDVKRPFFTKLLRFLIIKWIYKNAWAVLSMGQPGLAASRIQGCPESKLRNLPIPVDLEVSRQIDQASREKAAVIRRHYAPEEETIFLCAGRLSPEKGYEVALQAFARVLSQNTRKGAVLLFAGDGPSREELREIAASLGLSKQVHFLGWCQPEEMKILFYISDVLVNPSIWDRFGVVILEAMAWSLPVLASDQTMAAVDRVQHGESGFIHGVGDIAELSKHMRYFLNDPAQIALMGARARQTAEQWPASQCVQTILDLV